MKTRNPTSKEIEKMVSFLPWLYGKGIEPIKVQNNSCLESSNGLLMLNPPDYPDIVEDFFHLASSDCWTDYDYDPSEARRLLEDDNLIMNANLAQIKTMLTYCVRGERFCDGHWGAMIEEGYIRRILQRLEVLLSGSPEENE
jgi:hypothetical protein